MIKVDQDKCIGCGKCVSDCFGFAIEMKDGKAYYPEDRRCMECGHCLAVCPVNAITFDNYDMSEVLELKDLDMDFTAEQFLNHMKSRRSIRKFTKDPVTKEQIEMILEAGRYAPTGGNQQKVAYNVYQNNIAEYRDITMDALRDLGETAQRNGFDPTGGYAKFWLAMYRAYKDYGKDQLFFDAGTVIAISANNPQAAIIAAAHMETMIYALGLGMVYSGFTTRAIADSKKLQEYMQLKDDYQVWAVLVVGKPSVTYERTVVRKPIDVIWE